MTYRNPKLTRLAHGLPCTWPEPHDCSGPDTTVWAHSNMSRHGKGTGHKAHDCYGAVLCSEAHRLYDEGPMRREAKEDAFARAMERTWLELWERALITVVR